MLFSIDSSTFRFLAVEVGLLTFQPFLVIPIPVHHQSFDGAVGLHQEGRLAVVGFSFDDGVGLIVVCVDSPRDHREPVRADGHAEFVEDRIQNKEAGIGSDDGGEFWAIADTHLDAP